MRDTAQDAQVRNAIRAWQNTNTPQRDETLTKLLEHLYPARVSQDQ